MFPFVLGSIIYYPYYPYNSSYRGKFWSRKQNLVRVSGVFKLSEFELTEWKWLKSWVKSKGIETQFELAGEFELSEF